MKYIFLFILLFLPPFVEASSLGVFPSELIFENLTEEEQTQTITLVNDREEKKITFDITGSHLKEALSLEEETLLLQAQEIKHIQVKAKGPLYNNSLTGLLLIRTEDKKDFQSALALKLQLSSDLLKKPKTRTYPSLTGLVTKEAKERNVSRISILIGTGLLFIIGIITYATKRHRRQALTKKLIKKNKNTTRYPVKKRRKQRGTSFLSFFKGGGNHVKTN